MTRGTQQRSQSVNPTSMLPRSQYNRTRGPTLQPKQGPKKDTPTDPVSMPQWVAALSGPTEYQAGGFNVVVGQSIHNPIPTKSIHKKIPFKTCI